MTPEQVFQLYAPLAGLLALAFWTGVLSQRVKSLEEHTGTIAETRLIAGALQETVKGLQHAVDGLSAAVTRIDDRAHSNSDWRGKA